MSLRDQAGQVRHGLVLMVSVRSAPARVLRAGALYLVLFAVLTATLSLVAPRSLYLLAALTGVAGIHPFMRWVAARAGAQDPEESTKV